MSTTAETLAKLEIINSNPSSVIGVQLDKLKEALNGDDISDASSPFMFLLESNATNCSAAINKMESVSRKIYPELAVTKSDLYSHMSDRDYVNTSYTPGSTEINLLLPLANLLENTPPDGVLEIPEYTAVKAGNVELGIYYPIRITVMGTAPNQTVSAEFVASNGVNPLKPLNVGVLETRKVKYKEVEYIRIVIPMDQFSVTSKIYTVDTTTTFKKNIELDGNFMYLRVFGDTGTEWVELRTTQGIHNYDINYDTIRYELLEGGVVVNFPDVYGAKDKYKNLRVDIYTTEGPIDLNLLESNMEDFSIRLTTYDDYNNRSKITPIESIPSKVVYANKTLFGGTLPLTIEELREKVVYHYDATKPPLYNSDLKNKLKADGFNLVKYNDNITNRVYVATKGLPPKLVDELETAVKVVNVETAVILDDELYGLSIRDNGTRGTIIPDALFITENGNTRVLNDVEITDIINNPLLINNGVYTYTPFYYVIDNTVDSVKVRPYHLSAPSIEFRTFRNTAGSSDITVNSKSIEIELVDDKYVIKVEAEDVGELNESTNEVSNICSLLYRSANGTIIGRIDNVTPTDKVYTFELPTNFDVNQNNITTVYFGTQAVDIALVDKFEVSYSETDAYEEVTFKLGSLLSELYSPIKKLKEISGIPKLHSVDKLATYDEIVYLHENDNLVYNSEAMIEASDAGDPIPEMEYCILHNVGDVIYSDFIYTRGANPQVDNKYNLVVKTPNLESAVYVQRAGEVVYTESGAVDLLKEPEVLHMVGLTAVDAVYRFADDSAVKVYSDTIVDTLISYVDEVTESEQYLDEHTEMYYKPKGANGTIFVDTGDGLLASIDSDVNFNITYHLSKVGYNDEAIVTQVKNATSKVINDHISRNVLSISDISDSLRAALGINVVTIYVEPFGPNGNITMMSLINESDSFTIREFLVGQKDGTYNVADNLNLNFKLSTT